MNPRRTLFVAEHLLVPVSEEDPPLSEALPKVGLCVRIVDVVDLELLLKVSVIVFIPVVGEPLATESRVPHARHFGRSLQKRIDAVGHGLQCVGKVVETLAALVDVYAVARQGGRKYRWNLEVALVVPEVLKQPDSAFQMAVGDICLPVEPFPVSGAVGGFELVKFAVADVASSAAYFAWHEINAETVCVSHRDAAGFLT